MAKNVFISFRFSDGNRYKEYLSGLFDKYSDTIDYSEDVDIVPLSLIVALPDFQISGNVHSNVL